MAESTRYEIAYWGVPALADLPRMLLDVAGASYENTFIDRDAWRGGVKESTTFGKIPKLTIHSNEGTKKVLFETIAIESYLAETLSLVPGPDAFSRAECLSVVSSLKDMMDKVNKSSALGTVEERREGHKKNVAEVIPSFLRFHERFVVSRGGPYYFGDKLTVADLMLYTVFLNFAAMYGSNSPFKTGQYPALAKLVEMLDGGRAGDYARNRRLAGNFVWHEDDQKWGLPKQA